MLKNISQEPVTLRWNSQEKVLKPGDVINVLEFNISPNEVGLLEQRFGSKNRGKLEVLPQPGLSAAAQALPVPEQVLQLQEELQEADELLKENAGTIADLQKQIREKDKEIEELKKPKTAKK